MQCALYAQCGGKDGRATCHECPHGAECKVINEWYHQCAPKDDGKKKSPDMPPPPPPMKKDDDKKKSPDMPPPPPPPPMKKDDDKKKSPPASGMVRCRVCTLCSVPAVACTGALFAAEHHHLAWFCQALMT